MNNNNNEMPVKDLKSLFENKFGNNIEIKNVNWKHLTDPGENYGSLVLEVNVTMINDNNLKTINVVIKLPPPSIYLLKLFNSSFTFKKEITFYKDLTPLLLEFQRECGIINPELSWLGANYYGSRMSINKNIDFDSQACIVLENLNYSGYKMMNRIIGLNKNQTEFAIKQLAKLHGLIIALRIKKSDVFYKLVLPSFKNVADETAKQCVMDMIKKSLDDLTKIPEAKKYIDIVNETIKKAGELEGKLTKDEKWCTMVHHDFWSNNMMFKLNGDEVIDMKIVDFQLYNYDYGIKDLIFFLLSSPKNDIIENIFDDMIDLYYNSFVNILNDFNVDINYYTKDKLINLMNICAPLKLAQCLMMAQVIKSSPGSAPKLETIDCKESFLSIGGGKAHYDKLLQVVNIYQKRQWFL